jgi:hypothetical protein
MLDQLKPLLIFLKFERCNLGKYFLSTSVIKVSESGILQQCDQHWVVTTLLKENLSGKVSHGMLDCAAPCPWSHTCGRKSQKGQWSIRVFNKTKYSDQEQSYLTYVLKHILSTMQLLHLKYSRYKNDRQGSHEWKEAK